MSIDPKKQLEQQLWNIASTLRGLINADEFRDHILGFIFYKYLSEKMELYANKILTESRKTIKYREIIKNTLDEQEFLHAIQKEYRRLTSKSFAKPKLPLISQPNYNNSYFAEIYFEN